MATTLTNASAAASEEFGGDEFSNNLFSDLAPLLTLFGEQVTKQFLSMSLGWADNILLAMGPLGIMTIIVSAIRVGGVRQLKAIIGRARESRSTAEQELLSSTSADVCELWSGKEIVRLIGSPAGMKNLVVVGPKCGDEYGSTRVLDIATACSESFLRSPGMRSGMLLDELSEAAPNLALNVKNATAKPLELWVCATIGVTLQAAAIVFPGLATYHWKFEKAGTPVPAYGYPCFLIGTLLVIIGVAACGHVIEGITTEHYFTAETKGQWMTGEVVKKVVRLQRCCTVSDQHFASFAIQNSPDDLDVRTSRLNKTDYSSLAATATVAAVVGFIAQFIGLRALHWSATIVQLGVTLIMTGIRAYVRRGLATNPICSSIVDGHEAAWLAMRISRDLDRESPASATASREERTNTSVRRPLVARIKEMLLVSPGTVSEADMTYAPAVWELPCLQFPVRGLDFWTDRRNASTRRRGNLDVPEEALIVESEELCSMFFPSQRRSQSSSPEIDTLRRKAPLRLKNMSFQPSMEVELHGSIQALMPQLDDAATIGMRLAMAIERVAAKCAGIDTIQWGAGGNVPPSSISFSLPVDVQTLGGSSRSKPVNLNVRWRASETNNQLEEERETSNSRAWVLEDRYQFKSVLSLWQYTVAERERAYKEICATNHAYFLAAGRDIPSPDTWSSKGQAYVRVVGYTKVGNSKTMVDGPRPNTAADFGCATGDPSFVFGAEYQPQEAQQQDWLGRHVFTTSNSKLGVLSVESLHGDGMILPVRHDWPVFGAFVSELSSDSEDGSEHRDYFIYTDTRTGLVMQCAHEILSLFFLTVASMITRVGGKTTRLPDPTDPNMPERDNTRAPRLMVNSVFRELAQEIVDTGMAHDITEAYTLIIPAFDHYGLLPTQADNEVVAGPVVDEAAQIDNEYRNDNLDGPGEGEVEGA